MRSLTLSVLLLTLSACGDSGGDTTSTTTGPGTSTDASTGAGSSTTSGNSVEPTTGDGTTLAPETGSVTMTTTTGEPGTTTTTEATSGELTTGELTTGELTTGDATTGDASSTGDVSSTGDTTGGATSELEIAIVDAELYADCMPEIAPDPAMGSWYVEFTNNGAAETSATVTKASLSLAVDMPEIEEIKVSPVDSGPLPPGETTSLEVEKLKGAKHSACEHCGEFYLLRLEYQEGDVTHVVTEDVTISCAF